MGMAGTTIIDRCLLFNFFHVFSKYEIDQPWHGNRSYGKGKVTCEGNSQHEYDI